MARFLLVHGAWEGGGIWRSVVRRLHAAGHEVYAPSLTGLGARRHLLGPEIGLGTHIQDVLGVINDEELYDIVLVGHSYGGMVVTGVADRVPERIASLVYLDAFVPDDGQSIQSLLPPAVRHPAAPGVAWQMPLPPTAFFGLRRPETIAHLAAHTSPQPAACFSEPVKLTGGIGRIGTKTFICATDPPLFTRFYEKLKDRADWTVHTLPCSHFVPLEMPDELTALLLGAIPS